jgi:hypothetical protein
MSKKLLDLVFNTYTDQNIGFPDKITDKVLIENCLTLSSSYDDFSFEALLNHASATNGIASHQFIVFLSWMKAPFSSLPIYPTNDITKKRFGVSFIIIVHF